MDWKKILVQFWDERARPGVSVRFMPLTREENHEK